MRGRIAVVVAGLLAAALGGCPGAEDDCARDADCPAGSRCVKNGEHRVCLGAEGGSGGGGAGGSGGVAGSGGGGGTGCADGDRDGVCDDVDLCPAVADPGQEDADGDRRGDACDPCPADPENDADADGVCGDADNCPSAGNPGQENLDGDTLGDACDPDVDGDGAADGDDCAPRDPAVYPGAVDPCDGVDADCVPSRCALALEGAGWAVRDVTCAPGTRTCAVALRGEGEAGRVVALGLAGEPETIGTIEVDGVRGVAIDPRHPAGPVVWSVLQGSIVGHASGGPLLYELQSESQTLAGGVELSAFGTEGLAIHNNASLIQFFNPAELGPVPDPPPASASCGSTNPACKSLGLRNLSDGASTLGLKSCSRLALRHDSDSVPAQVYVSFSDDTRLAIASVRIDGSLEESSSGLVAGFGEGTELSVTPNGQMVVALGRDGDGAISHTAVRPAGHVWQPFTLPSCPTALLARDADLLVASRCEGEAPELLVLPVTDGLPDAAAATSLPLPGCTPVRMAASPSLGTDGPDAVLIGCEESATVLVLGRD